jgi:hypothetical protein
MVKKYYIGSLLVQRYGHLLIPSWVYGSLVSAPSANTSLVSFTVGAGKRGYIYGFFISASETNDFNIEFTDINGDVRTYRIVLAGKGTVHYADIIPLNEGIPAKEQTTISIKNINAGSTDSYYQAGLLVGEIGG